MLPDSKRGCGEKSGGRESAAGAGGKCEEGLDAAAVDPLRHKDVPRLTGQSCIHSPHISPYLPLSRGPA